MPDIIVFRLIGATPRPRFPSLLNIWILFFVTIVLLTISGVFVALAGAEGNLAREEMDHFSLEEYRGAPLLLEIVNIESPICRECEEVLAAQTAELARLRASYPNLTLVTINLRKNPYSQDGMSLAKEWWSIEVDWPWYEDFQPYPVASEFAKYWTLGSGFANPTFILVEPGGQVSSVIHVYQIGKGQIDGVQSAELLYAKVYETATQGLSSKEGSSPYQGMSALGMFFLGILTSFSPCSIALMIAVFSYMMTSWRKEKRKEEPERSYTLEGFFIGLAFTLGMSVVFLVLGLFISQMGEFIRGSRMFDLVAGILLVTLGLSNLYPLGNLLEPLTSRLHRSRDVSISRESPMERIIGLSMRIFQHSALLGGFVLGVFFALGWAPCAVSLIFPVIIWLMSQDVSALQGGVMLFIFGLGHGVPIIPIATFSRSVGARIGDRYIAAGRWITKVFGIVVMVVGMMFAARYFGYVLW